MANNCPKLKGRSVPQLGEGPGLETQGGSHFYKYAFPKTLTFWNVSDRFLFRGALYNSSPCSATRSKPWKPRFWGVGWIGRFQTIFVFYVFNCFQVFYTYIYNKATYKCKAGGFNMRLDKDPGDNWSKKFGVECLNGDVPTWEEPDWPTCASSEFWLKLPFGQISLYSHFC